MSTSIFKYFCCSKCCKQTRVLCQQESVGKFERRLLTLYPPYYKFYYSFILVSSNLGYYATPITMGM